MVHGTNATASVLMKAHTAMLSLTPAIQTLARIQEFVQTR